MRLLLIPVASGLPAVHDYLSRLDGSRPFTPAEVAELSRLVIRCVATSEALLDYARVLAAPRLIRAACHMAGRNARQ